MRKTKEAGITLISVALTVIVMIILAVSITINLKKGIATRDLLFLRTDIEILTQKITDFYNEYGELPASVRYTNISELTNSLDEDELNSRFYVIDLQAIDGLSLHYGRDYENVKDANTNVDIANQYKDIYIINDVTHNVYYVKGIKVEDNDAVNVYYTNKDE